MKEDVREFSLEAIQPNLRLIQHLESIEALCRSIQLSGQTQPIHVWFDGWRFRIVDGEKRWRACRKLGMTMVKAVIVDVTYQG
jgi:ParB family chromosome partitioning protein